MYLVYAKSRKRHKRPCFNNAKTCSTLIVSWQFGMFPRHGTKFPRLGTKFPRRGTKFPRRGTNQKTCSKKFLSVVFAFNTCRFNEHIFHWFQYFPVFAYTTYTFTFLPTVWFTNYYILVYAVYANLKLFFFLRRAQALIRDHVSNPTEELRTKTSGGAK